MTSLQSRRPLRIKTTRGAECETVALADRLASGLKITDSATHDTNARDIPQRKGKRRLAEPSKEDKINHMRNVNASLQSLASIAQSDWKASRPRKGIGHTVASISAIASSALASLNSLRRLTPGVVEVERAASSVIAKLVMIEMYGPALELLQNMYHPLILLCHPGRQDAFTAVAQTTQSHSNFDPTAHFFLLSLPLPKSSTSLDAILQSLVNAYFCHVFTVLIHYAAPQPTIHGSFLDALSKADSFLSWTNHLTALPRTTIDSTLKRIYVELTKSFVSPALPVIVLRFRSYALKYLLLTSDLDSNTFWQQVLKIGAAHIKNLGPRTDEEQAQATQYLLEIFRGIVEDVENGNDKDSILRGSGWIAFCEYWLSLTKRTGDLILLNRIVLYIQSSSSSSTQTACGKEREFNENVVTEPSPTEMEERGLLASKICATFAQMTALLDRLMGSNGGKPVLGTDDLVKCIDASTMALQNYLQMIKSPTNAAIDTKVMRALEKLRRTALKMLDHPPALHEHRQVARRLAENIVDTIQHLLESAVVPKEGKAELRVSALDTVFTLATTVLVPANAETYELAYNYLASTLCVVRFSSDTAHAQADNEVKDIANYLRCISGAFFNLAGTLYKASKFGAAVRFFKDACPLGEKALQLSDGACNGKDCCQANSRGAPCQDYMKDRRPWIDLRSHLYKRWELLGVCYSKIGDRKLAYDSFLRSIQRYPFQDEFDSLLRTTRSTDVFSTSSYQQLGSMIDRLTYIGAAELFLKRGTSLLDSLRDAGVPTICIGAVLERQIQGLDGSKWKPAVRDVIQWLLEDMLVLYGKNYPVRRAWVLISQLEYGYFSGSVKPYPDEIGEEVQSLLINEDLGQDLPLIHLRAQYLASVHIWLALHAHRRGDLNMDWMLQHLTEACNLLQSMTTSITGQTPKKSQRRSSGAGSGRHKAVTKGTTVTEKNKTSKAVKKLPVTPKSRKVVSSAPGLSGPETSPKATSRHDQKDHHVDFEGLMTLLYMVTRLLGLLGYVLMKIQFLSIMRRLSSRHNGNFCEVHVRTSIDMAHELVKIGKTEQAGLIYAHTLNVIRSQGTPKVPDQVVVIFFLRYAEFLVLLGNVSQSVTMYDEALALSETLTYERKAMSTSARIRDRVLILERAALAATVYAAIQHASDDPVRSLDSLLRALRLYNRATDTLARLNPPSVNSEHSNGSNDPFELSDMKNALQLVNDPTPALEEKTIQKAVYQKTAMDGLEWRIADNLFHTLFALSQAYFTRGSAREAEYFAQQAETLANSIHLPAMLSRALARKSEVQLLLGHGDDVQENLTKASSLLEEIPGTDAVDIRRLRGDHCYRSRQEADAKIMYDQAATMLNELEMKLVNLEHLPFGSSHRKSSVASPKSAKAFSGTEALAPVITASLLRQQIWLLREDAGEKYKQLLNRFLALPSWTEIKAETNALLGKLAFHDIHGRFRVDMFLSSLAESTIALPMGMTGDQALVQSAPTHDILGALSHAEKLFSSGLESFSKRGRVTNMREAALSLALVNAFQTSLGKPGKHRPTIAANLLDMASSMTLRREIIDAIQHKFPDLPRREDLLWPSISQNESPDGAPRKRLCLDSSVDFDDEVEQDDEVTRGYWQFILKKYKSQTFDIASLSTSETDMLPNNWVVVNISVTDDKSTLLMSRQRPRREPLIFCIPLKGRRDSSDDEHFTFTDALKELKDIIIASDEGTKQASEIKPDDMEGKAAWWSTRKELDRRLKELLDNIEFCWLGAFKTILSQPMRAPPDVIPALRTRFEKVFKHILGSQEKKLKTRFKLDNCLLECFSTLSPSCRDEELEDLVYFILDLYHFHGVPVALAEVDVDQVAVDLRTALEEHHAKVRGRVTPEPDSHMFLVLDKNVQGIPWESIPILRGRSVSRIPGVSFLIDRLQLVRLQRGLPICPTGETKGQDKVEKVDRACINPSNAFYVLNPSGDLSGTEGRFSGWLKDMTQVGWEGVVGRQPSEQQFLDALAKKDLVVYFGHGGAEQYVRSHKIRHLPRCAATMLWGCSSGALRDMGDFDRVGTPYNYMLAGCPTLVANIWDVTDRDIDKFSLAVFSKLRLEPASVKKWQKEQKSPGEGSTSLVTAVAQSRDSCKLKYLTGAAPVVYGIPFYL